MNIYNVILTFMRLTPEMLSNARLSLCMIHTVTDDGFGTGVLVDNKTVITAAHNFETTKPKRCIVHHANSGTKRQITGSKINKDLDVAAIALSKPIVNEDAVPAQIDFDTEIRQKLFVAMPSFFKNNSGRRLHIDIEERKPTGDFRMVKGLMAHPFSHLSEEIDQSSFSSTTDKRDMYLLRGQRGDSGSPIFTERGQVLSIHTAGFGAKGAAPCAKMFRDWARKL